MSAEIVKQEEVIYKEITIKKKWKELNEGHVGMYEISFNSETNLFEAHLPDSGKKFKVPEEYWEENNPNVKIVD